MQIASEIKKLTLAQPGTRHNTLIQVSKALGQWIGGGHLDEDKARDLLHQAADACDYTTEHGTDVTVRDITDGIKFGKQSPRHPPVRSESSESEPVGNILPPLPPVV